MVHHGCARVDARRSRAPFQAPRARVSKQLSELPVNWELQTLFRAAPSALTVAVTEQRVAHRNGPHRSIGRRVAMAGRALPRPGRLAGVALGFVLVIGVGVVAVRPPAWGAGGSAP